MHDEIFSDGIGEITINGTVVRIDLVSLSPTERDAANNPKPVFRQRVVMPIDAFANAAELVQKALNGLIDAGAVSRPQPGGARPIGLNNVPDSTPRKTGHQTPAANGSPNFN